MGAQRWIDLGFMSVQPSEVEGCCHPRARAIFLCQPDGGCGAADIFNVPRDFGGCPDGGDHSSA